MKKLLKAQQNKRNNLLQNGKDYAGKGSLLRFLQEDIEVTQYEYDTCRLSEIIHNSLLTPRYGWYGYDDDDSFNERYFRKLIRHEFISFVEAIFCSLPTYNTTRARKRKNTEDICFFEDLCEQVTSSFRDWMFCINDDFRYVGAGNIWGYTVHACCKVRSTRRSERLSLDVPSLQYFTDDFAAVVYRMLLSKVCKCRVVYREFQKVCECQK